MNLLIRVIILICVVNVLGNKLTLVEDDYEASGSHDKTDRREKEKSNNPLEDGKLKSNKTDETNSDIHFDENEEKIKQEQDNVRPSVKMAENNGWKAFKNILDNISTENYTLFTIGTLILIFLIVITCKLGLIRRKVKNLAMNKEIILLEKRINQIENNTQSKDTTDTNHKDKKVTKIPVTSGLKSLMTREEQSFRKSYSLPPNMRKKTTNEKRQNENFLTIQAYMETPPNTIRKLSPEKNKTPPAAEPFLSGQTSDDEYRSCSEEELRKAMMDDSTC